MGQPLELRTEKADHILARGDGIDRSGTPGSHPAPELRGHTQQPCPPQPQPADHAQAGLGFVGHPRERTAVGIQQGPGQAPVFDECREQFAVGQGLDAPHRHFVRNFRHD